MSANENSRSKLSILVSIGLCQAIVLKSASIALPLAAQLWFPKSYEKMFIAQQSRLLSAGSIVIPAAFVGIMMLFNQPLKNSSGLVEKPGKVPQVSAWDSVRKYTPKTSWDKVRMDSINQQSSPKIKPESRRRINQFGESFD